MTLCSASMFAQNEYTRLHKHTSFWPIEETHLGTFISVESCIFLGSGPFGIIVDMSNCSRKEGDSAPRLFWPRVQYFNENRQQWSNRTCSLLHTVGSVANPKNEPPHVRRCKFPQRPNTKLVTNIERRVEVFLTNGAPHVVRLCLCATHS